MSYNREYENITLKYSLPSRMWHPSSILEKYVNRIASQKCISPEEVIDAYVEIYLKDLEKNVTKMIRHDGNKFFKSPYDVGIIDAVLDEDEWIKRLLGIRDGYE